ncbi:uncharacterized protein KQ657_004342 [Scheffersomyces spartinae]|uniref:Brix domain-containing protein n=1 Tax=Scheffersomyces spartinae TaxID=45513 RepID=A0A9P7VAV6_9ASCO|nr:uncharacterized protein KQ657_004342 [Scheffersomyces spartinae]KAG7194666.1 hypothetical protein KQ657_004342 [Scheffersomyces spartinae]
MAKRRTKTRTHTKVSEEELAKIPRSMVLRLGLSLQNHLLSQLVKDFRNIMQPHTAINLRERKSNRLKDFIVMAGPLGVSDLFVFHQSEESGNISLRLGKMPRGPTLQFRINTYALAKDVRRILKRPKSLGKDSTEFLHPPLLVMNGFLTNMKEADNHEKLMVTVFQGMFPPIQPQNTKVSSIKRVLMINKDKETGTIELRHYAISTKLVEENRNIKKLINSHHNPKKSLPIMTKNQDVSDLLLDPYSVGGLTSDSEIEDDAIVEIKNEQVIKKTTTANESAPSASTSTTRKRAIKLIELGPRISMDLYKIEEGLVGSSKTIYHSQVHKTDKELKQLNKKHALMKQEKAQRRALQKANVDAKKAKKEEKKAKRKAKQNEQTEQTDDDEVESSEDEINPDDYENDSDLFSDIEK